MLVSLLALTPAARDSFTDHPHIFGILVETQR
jgi:hypothetical protein